MSPPGHMRVSRQTFVSSVAGGGRAGLLKTVNAFAVRARTEVADSGDGLVELANQSIRYWIQDEEWVVVLPDDDLHVRSGPRHPGPFCAHFAPAHETGCNPRDEGLSMDPCAIGHVSELVARKESTGGTGRDGTSIIRDREAPGSNP